MWWELYIVLCGAVKGRLENREEMNKTQWLINVFFFPPVSGRPILSPSPWMTEHNWSKSKLNYIHSSIYKNIPSTLYRYYSRIKQKIKFLKRPKYLQVLLSPCFSVFSHYNDIFANCCWCCQSDFSLCSGFLSRSDIRAAFLNQL